MKVAFCTYDGAGAMNGINAWLSRLLPDLKRRGIEPVVYAITWAPFDQCSTLPQLQAARIECRIIEAIYRTDAQLTALLQMLSEDPPDVFVPGHAVPALFAGHWVRDAGIPTVAILHNDDDEFAGIADQFVFGSQEYRSTALVAVSKKLFDDVQGRDTKGTRVIRIPYGSLLPEKVAAPAKDTFRILYLGRLVEKQKRIAQVTRALCEATHLVSGVEARILGDGPDAGLVDQIIREENGASRVSRPGLIPSAKIFDELLSAHALISLSDYEGLPLAVQEAMACGVVPICKRTESGVPELIENGISGLLIEGDPQSFVEAVRRLRSESGLWEKLSRAARAKIESEFNHTRSVDLWETLLRDLAKQHRRHSAIVVPTTVKLPKKDARLVEDVRVKSFTTRVLNRLRAL